MEQNREIIIHKLDIGYILQTTGKKWATDNIENIHKTILTAVNKQTNFSNPDNFPIKITITVENNADIPNILK